MKDRVDALAGLVAEYELDEATWVVDGSRVTLKKKAPQVVASPVAVAEGVAPAEALSEEFEDEAPEAAQVGIPISSPMPGIFYSSPNPTSPPFVKEGDTVTAGQTVGLIEAMKMYNEIHAPTSGTVVKVVAENGQLVHRGDPLLFIG